MSSSVLLSFHPISNDEKTEAAAVPGSKHRELVRAHPSYPFREEETGTLTGLWGLLAQALPQLDMKVFYTFICIQLIYNGVLVSGIRESGSAEHISVPILLQNIMQSSLCYTAGACWFSILYVYVNSNLPTYCFPHLPALVTRQLLSKCVSLFLFCKKRSFVSLKKN